MTHITHITCPHCNDTYPTFDAAHVCSKGPYAPKLKPKMNERIRRLMEQAVISIDGQTFGKTYIPDAFTEKFAELIIKECITIVDEQKECLHEEQQYWHDRDYGYALAVDDASRGIKQYFGVK
jgi:hypothetical protein